MASRPPRDWIDDPVRLGGDRRWGPSGSVAKMLKETSVDTSSMKPLYAMGPWLGGELVLFQAGSPTVYYFFSPLSGSVLKIVHFTDLQKIVEWIDDEDRGYASIQTEVIV